MKRRLILMRGPPGSGKSTYAKNMFPEAFICSADHWFIRNGTYEYVPEEIGEAHVRCQVSTLQCMAANTPLIIVDNTNTQHWQTMLYTALAAAFGYAAEAIWVKTSLETCLSRNIHDVPDFVIEDMINRFEEAIGVPQTVVEEK